MLRIVNPEKTNWYLLDVSRKISFWIEKESQGNLANMLPQSPTTIHEQAKKGLTFVAISGIAEEVVGHITLWLYPTAFGWGEIGSLIVDPSCRGLGAGKMLISAILKAFCRDFNLVATTKTEKAGHLFQNSGFRPVKFDELRATSEAAWRECCPCHLPPEYCLKRDKECKLFLFFKKEE